MKKINESFTCLQCKNSVPSAQKTCRNHCPYCFASQHVDGAIPGDRIALQSCAKQMVPIEYLYKHGGVKIHFICIGCGKSHWNKTLEDDDLTQLDDAIKKGKQMLIHESHFVAALQKYL